MFELRTNPFTDEYMAGEVDFYDLTEPYDKDGVVVKMQNVAGRCDDYLNKNMRFSGIDVPTLFIDKKLWMSMTWMEVQSAYLALERAVGDCATGGLGLGYYTLKLMADDNVDSIDVYEREPRIVDFFKEKFGGRSGFEKVNFIVGDVREEMVDKEYNHVFMDIYPNLCSSEVISDYKLFNSKNYIEDYNFWTQEKIILAGLVEHDLGTVSLEYDEAAYFRTWRDTPISDTGYTMSELYQDLPDEEYVREVLEMMGKIHD